MQTGTARAEDAPRAGEPRCRAHWSRGKGADTPARAARVFGCFRLPAGDSTRRSARTSDCAAGASRSALTAREIDGECWRGVDDGSSTPRSRRRSTNCPELVEDGLITEEDFSKIAFRERGAA